MSDGRHSVRAPWRASRLATIGAAVALLGAGAVAPAATAASRATVKRAAAAHAARPQAASSCPWLNDSQPVAQRVSEVLNQMSIDDEITLVEGHGTNNPYVFYTPAIPSLCIPQVGEEDGPAGVADGLTGVTQLPAPVSLAATFDPTLAQQYGGVIGSEEYGKGAAVNLGPTVNIDRDPRWGRSFEAFTEDPYLNSSLAVNEIDGVQGQGELSQVKHFDAYNQETNRNTPADDVVVSERTLHEIYMPAFEAAVKQAHVASLMCAYSVVNGNYSCESSFLLTGTLRELWDFPGFVTSDYGAIHDTSAAEDGTDQEQPFNTYFGAPLQAAVETGLIPRRILNTMVSRVLTELFRFNIISHPPTGTTTDPVTTPGHQDVASRVAEAGTVLLKNDGATLPLTSGHSVAVIGPAASTQVTTGGGGSAHVIPPFVVTPLQGIQSAGGSGNVTYAQGLPNDADLTPIPSSDLSPAYSGTPYGGYYKGTLTAPETGTYVLAITNPCGCYTSTYLTLDGKPLIDDPSTPPVNVYSAAVQLVAGQTYQLGISGDSSALTWATPSDLAPGIQAAVNAAKSASRAVVVVSDDAESEAMDRPSLALPSAQDELISAVAAANPHTVVVINAGAPVTMPWLHQVAAVVDAWYPGESSGTALASVLYGQVNPGGHLPVTFPASLSQVPASTPARFPGLGGRVYYQEGVDVGYRWYDARGITPLFPFGYGLSYTRFAFSSLRVTPSSTSGTGVVHVSGLVTNVGSRPGTDVAQLYLGDPASTGEPPRQLVGFQRVELAPGHSQRVSFTTTPRDTWWWNGSAYGWSQTAGLYRVYMGDSSALANLPLRGSYTLSSALGARQVSITGPDHLAAGQGSVYKVRLGAGGSETVPFVRLAVQVPGQWQVRPLGPTVFAHVAPGQTPTAYFEVTPASYTPNADYPVHSTANFGYGAQREDGMMAYVTP